MKNNKKPTISNSLDHLLSIAKDYQKKQIDSYNNDSNSNWFLFLIFYILTVKKLINDLPDKKISSAKIDENRATIVPTIYLFKHTLELLFKYAQVTIQKQVGNHDINSIKRSFDIGKIYRALKIEKISEEFGNDVIKTKKIIKKTFDDLELLSDDYFFGHFLYFSKKDLNFTIIDKQNEIFKYPVNHNVNIQMSPISLYELDEKSIEKIKKDFSKLEQIFSNLFLFFSKSNLE